LRLTSEQLQALDLRPGANTITFSLASSGVVACAARIFLWEHTDSVVVSDIDGTITKSDALGHMFTLIGRDWTHLGVAKLYTDIVKNGYKIMYLTSRAIGQADSTRYYLRGIKQNDYQLPEGPVVMSPDRLMASLHREVIMRKPEVFKMACLRDIQRLFGPAMPYPFYAGFGNRITDALSYRSVNIPSSRIFTIDSLGEVKMELLDLVGHKSESVQSYIHMTDLVDQMFPPITNKWDNDFTDSNYWKAPLVDFPLPDLAPPSPALSARSDTSNKSAFARLRHFSLRSTGSSRSRSFAPSPPPADDRRGRDMNTTGAHSHQRQLSSIERISNTFVGLASRSVSPDTPSSYEPESEGEDLHGASDAPGRRRRSRPRSMPGSLPGSPHSSDDEDLEFGVADKGIDDTTSGQVVDMVEQEFDEDLFATISKMAHY
jgi:phosphatidate phosphatase LPIN